MKILLPIFLAAALTAGCAGTNFNFNQARQVQVGMTPEQVQKIMGKPYMISSQGTNTVWVYSYASGFGGAKSVSFIFMGDKVAAVPTIPSSFH